jgi:ABC transport system ATP-binding/permease protein
MTATMHARLLCRTGALSGKTYALTAETVIGRGDGANVLIASELVSGRHASIRQDSTGFILEDLGSANGTWVDGERVVRPVRLDTLNVISLARTFDLIFHVDAGTPSGATTAAPRPAPKVAPTVVPQVAPPAAPKAAPKAAPGAAPKAAPKAAPGAAPKAEPTAATESAKETQLIQMGFGVLPTLESDAITSAAASGSTTVLEGPFGLPALDAGTPTAPAGAYCLEINRVGSSPRTIELMPSRRYTLGRATDCDIQLDDAKLSRHHATVTVGDAVMVEDAGSKLGTHMHGRRLTGPTVLTPGSAFMLGTGISVRLIAR